MANVSGGGGGPSTAIPRKYRSLAQEASRESGLPLKVVAAQISEESGWQPNATSPTGAEGIAQFEPGTWSSWGHGSAYNPQDAMPAYGRFMGHLLKQYHGDIRDALAAYNAGPGNLQAGYSYADQILGAAGYGQGSHSQAIPYKNPLRDVGNLTPERIDMGVDYGGSGPVYALGPGVITSTTNAGWPGGGFIAEKLSKGPLAGRYVYVAENVSPTVQVGDQVTADTQIGQMTGGIETGFASPPGTGNALGASQFTGSNATAYGKAYSNVLHSLGAPAGTTTGPVTTTSSPSWISNLLKGGLLGIGGVAGDKAVQDAGGVAGALSNIGDSIKTFEEVVAWFLVPSHWVRIFCGIGGGFFVIYGIALMSRTGRAYSVSNPAAGMSVMGFSPPSRIPAPGGELAPAMGIAAVTIGAILLFVAFHNLPDTVGTFPEFISYLQQGVKSGSLSGAEAGGVPLTGGQG